MARSIETKANDCFHQGLFEEAITHYTSCLESLPPGTTVDSKISLLFNRSSCYLKQKHYQDVVDDCHTILNIDSTNARAFSRQIKALRSLGHFTDALKTAQQWTTVDPQNDKARKEVERLGIILSAMKEQDGDEDDDILVLDGPSNGEEPDVTRSKMTITAAGSAVTSGATNGASQSATDSQSALTSGVDTPLPKSGSQKDSFRCSYCNISFSTNKELQAHYKSDSHIRKKAKREEELDEERDSKKWKHRPPPRGLTADEYSLCPRYFQNGQCRFESKCTHAHSSAELAEWKERFECRKQQVWDAKHTGVAQTSSYTDQFMEKLMKAENQDLVMKDSLDNIKVHVNSDLALNITTKKHTHSWTFTLTSRDCMSRVFLLEESNKTYFSICSITVGPKKSQKVQNIEENCQEWTNKIVKPKGTNENVYRIKVNFKTEIYGTFRQTVIFDFGSEPVLCQQISVDSSPVDDIEKLAQDLIVTERGRWDVTKAIIVAFEPSPMLYTESDHLLLERYQPPPAEELTMSESWTEVNLNKNNYRKRMHDLLYVEEMAQYASIAKYNIKSSVQVVDKFILLPSNNSTAKYAQNGELFARLKLNTDVSEDTPHGRLILQNVSTVLLAPFEPKKKKKDVLPEKLYEAIVEEKGKDFIILRLSSKCVSDLGMKAEQEHNVEVQCQLNRLPLCEMHMAIDRLKDTHFVFPNLMEQVNIPWNPKLQWSDKLDSRLNAKQKEAIVAVNTSVDVSLPPVLLIGPYGTGKTFTLAQATKQLLQQEGSRILICTHSNSAADLYIKDYFHPYVEDDHPEAKPLRVYFKHRWVQTVHENVLKYSLVKMEAMGRKFQMPTKEDIMNHRVIVATLSTSRYLYELDLPEDCFTHILLDEAAQALECEIIMPLAVAGNQTRVVLAGDHMQMSPEIHADFARDRNFHISLLERLYDLYSRDNTCKILLVENYRSHKAIIDYTSELFYSNNLVAGSRQPQHDLFYPLTFFTAKGEDCQHQNSTAFYNNSEVYEIVERIGELKQKWPESWGPLDDSSIGVVSPYVDQVVRIRSELRKKKLGNVSVERVFNVQGKQFRVIILSTVRTRHTCSSDTSLEDFVDFGFLSNAKLLNTAITRAQSLVAVVGDPVSLCSVGKCRKLWERFIEICWRNDSLYGITWSQLRSQLDGVELKKTFVLNPLAPEFIPNRLRHGDPVEVDAVKGPHGLHFKGSASPWIPRQNPMPMPPVYYPMTMYNPPYYVMPHFMAANPAYNRSRGGPLAARGASPVRTSPNSDQSDRAHASSPATIRSNTSTPTQLSPRSEDGLRSHSPGLTKLGGAVGASGQRLTPGVMPYAVLRPGMLPHQLPIPDYRHFLAMYRMQGPMSPNQAMLPGHPHPGYPLPPGMIPPRLPPAIVPPHLRPPVFQPLHVPAVATQPGSVTPKSDPESPPNNHGSNDPRPAPHTASNQQFQLLPNVRHIPPHVMDMMEKGQASGSVLSNSHLPRSQNPAMIPSGGGQKERDAWRHENTASGESRTSKMNMHTPMMSHSPLSQYSSAGSESAAAEEYETSTGVVPPWIRERRRQAERKVVINGHSSGTLDLAKNATSRDMSLSDITAPSQIDNVVKFITDEYSSESELGNIHIGQSPVNVPLPVPNFSSLPPSHTDRAVPLYMRRKETDSPASVNSESSQDQAPIGSPSERDRLRLHMPPSQLTYASVLRRQSSTSPSPHGLPPSRTRNLLQSPTTPDLGLSPTTPGAFHDNTPTPTGDAEANPLELLKNLNIKSSQGTQALYQYFS